MQELTTNLPNNPCLRVMSHPSIARFSVIYIIPDNTANTDLPNICAFVPGVCPEQSICLFCHPNREQRERLDERFC